jgi:1-acyl-sn-glycerol-3-phosphate acyltransferase
MNAWRYDTASDLGQTRIERLRRFPREPDMLVYGFRCLAALAIRAWLRMYHRLEVIGQEQLPAEGSFVLIANHSSHLDTLCMVSALPLRRIHQAFSAAAADYFFTSLPRMAVAAVVANALPFHRQMHCCKSLGLCRELLAVAGNILILFPEGTRSTSGVISPFKPGIGALVAGTDVPVVPCHITGAFEACPKGRILPRPRRLRLFIGAPRRFASFSPGKESALHISAELQEAVLELAMTNPAGFVGNGTSPWQAY